MRYQAALRPDGRKLRGIRLSDKAAEWAVLGTNERQWSRKSRNSPEVFSKENQPETRRTKFARDAVFLEFRARDAKAIDYGKFMDCPSDAAGMAN